MEKRIVVAGTHWYGGTEAGLSHGFRQLGWDVVEVDTREHGVNGRTLALRLAARALRGQAIDAYNRAILSAADAVRPRAFLTVKGSNIGTHTLDRLRHRGVVSVNYYPDYHFDHPGLDPATFPLYDHFVTTKSFQVEHLRSLPGARQVHFLHHGYCSMVHHPRLATIDEESYIADVLYVGNYTSYKERWIAAVAQQLPDVRLMVVGNGWQEAASRVAPQAVVSSGHILGDSYARLLQRARINLAVHSGPEQRHGWEDLVSTRTFEIPACRGFMLHIDNAEVRNLFEPGTEIDVFATPEQLAERITYYLARPELRRKMIERAAQRCVPAHSYDERARAIIAAIGETETSAAGRAAVSGHAS